MKKSISIFLCIVLILSCFSFSFAVDWSTTDQTNLSNAAGRLYYNGQSAAYYLYLISTRLTTLSNTVNDIKNALFDSGYSVAFWIHEVQYWMSPIYNSITQTPIDLATIIGALGYTDSNNNYHPYNLELTKALTNQYLSLGTFDNALNAHSLLTDGGSNYFYSLPSSNGTSSVVYTKWNQGSPIGNLALICTRIIAAITNSYTNTFAFGYSGYNTAQSFIDWSTLSTSSFTPTSSTNGLYTWLSKIQNPVARLSYVLASDERIEAQEAASANEQAVVDNFIDSSGSGAASTSDFDSIADFSSGYKSTFASDASPIGIFDIFNSNNMGWFSQETVNQLDTTSNNRAKSDNTFNTPLLDEQIISIYEQLGVKQP